MVPLNASVHARRWPWIALLLYAALVIYFSVHHVMWRDETQVWLLGRDCPSLGTLLFRLRSEGHPALWYLLVRPLAQSFTNPLAMQLLHAAIAIGAASIVLFASRLRLPERLLIVASYYLLYENAVIARNYSLPFALITAAVCLVERGYRWWSILLLMLAINSHALAVPVVAAVTLWIFLRDARTTSLRTTLTAQRTLAAASLLAIALVLFYFTVRPAPDLAAIHVQNPSLVQHFLLIVGIYWRVLVHLPIGWLPQPIINQLDPIVVPAPTAVVLSLLVFAAVFASLASRLARVFLVTGVALEVVLMTAILIKPDHRHVGFYFLIFVVALMIDRVEATPEDRPILAPRAAAAFIVFLLVVQLSHAVSALRDELHRPFSGVRATAEFLRAHHLEHNPLVLAPGDNAHGVLVYLDRKSAYLNSCKCFGSYESRTRFVDSQRMPDTEDLIRARQNGSLPVVVLTYPALSDAMQQQLGLIDLHMPAQNPIKSEENLSVYEQK